MSTIQTRSRPDFLEYCFTVGMTTMEGRGFYYPLDTAIGKDGRLYVVSRSLDRSCQRRARCTMCDAEGEYYGRFWVSFGEGDGQLMWPSGAGDR